MMTAALIVIFLILFYKFWINGFRTWKDRRIPYLPASFPFGTDWNLTTLGRFQGFLQVEMCNKAAEHPMFGVHAMRTPILFVKDPQLIRAVLTKEYSSFQNRHKMTIPEEDVLAQHLFNLEGERWRALRVKLTPTFTSGKLKAMFPLFVSCAEIFDSVLLSKLGTNVDIKDLVKCFTTDTICSCAFGLETNSLLEPDNKLMEIGRKSFDIDVSLVIKLALVRAIPKLGKFIMKRFTPMDVENYLVKLIADTVQYREKHGINRNDFLDLLIQLRNQGKLVNDQIDEKENKNYRPLEMTPGLMAAQCFVFFLAGYETSSSVQSFCLYELALHQDIQKKVREEIDKQVEKYGEITYQAVQEMGYLDMVISETMRKYPTISSLSRTCNKPYTTPQGQTIEPGDEIFIPVWALHYDPQYFPDPEKFDPERFSPYNKHSIVPFTYLPFGEGPRICIASRFGLIQTKLGLITTLKNYKVEPCKETRIPLEFKGTFLFTTTKQPIMLNLVKR